MLFLCIFQVSQPSDEARCSLVTVREEKEVQLTEMGGRKRVFGLNDLTRARAAEDTKKASMEKAALKGFL